MSMTTGNVDLLALSRAHSSLALAHTAALKARGAAGARASANDTSDSGSDGSNITSSDFLTLLVTEMQNQDPTQPTDPNAYIQQLVEVNSLQQLISINTDLSGVGASTGSAVQASKVAATPSPSAI